MHREVRLFSVRSDRRGILEIFVDPRAIGGDIQRAIKEVRTEIRSLGAIGATTRKRVQIWGNIPTPMALMMGHELGKVCDRVETREECGGFLPCIGF